MTAEEYLKGNSFSEFDPELNGNSACVELITALTAVEMAKREERERLMKHLIDKSAVVAELKKRFDYRVNGLKAINNGTFWDEDQSEDEFNAVLTRCAYNAAKNEVFELMCFLDILEVKEVDLDSDIRIYLTNHFNIYEDGVLQSKESELPLSTYDIIKVAKHFFELGMRSK